MSKNVENDVDAFLQELETIDSTRRDESATARGPRTVYEVIKPEMGKVYSGYTLVSYNDTTSPLGSESMVLRCVAPGNEGEPDAGRRVKFYLTDTKSKTLKDLSIKTTLLNLMTKVRKPTTSQFNLTSFER